MAASRRWRAPLAWCVVILLPLCIVGNKQFHYLMPLVAAIGIAVWQGWCGKGYRLPVKSARRGPAYRWVLLATLLVLFGVAVAIPDHGAFRRGGLDQRLRLPDRRRLSAIGAMWGPWPVYSRNVFRPIGLV